MPVNHLLKKYIETIWYSQYPLSYLLRPISWLYRLFIWLRYLGYQYGLIASTELAVPVIVIGNISVGGTGKTPLVIWLADYFQGKGFKPGIVSRGYGAELQGKTLSVRADSDPTVVGDEPVLLAKRTGCPVAVSVKRIKAAKQLIKHKNCDLILCDDGLQHYALARDIEIAVVDGQRRFGNHQCFPAGPLREPVSRLKSVDFVVSKYLAEKHEFKMEYYYAALFSITEPKKSIPLSELKGKTIHAVAGIGNPDNYFSHLRNHNLDIITHTFVDHHTFVPEDFSFDTDSVVVMTEKDAVKCVSFAKDNYWYLPITASLPDTFAYRLDILMKDLLDG